MGKLSDLMKAAMKVGHGGQREGLVTRKTPAASKLPKPKRYTDPGKPAHRRERGK